MKHVDIWRNTGGEGGILTDIDNAERKVSFLRAAEVFRCGNDVKSLWAEPVRPEDFFVRPSAPRNTDG